MAVLTVFSFKKKLYSKHFVVVLLILVFTTLIVDVSLSTIQEEEFKLNLTNLFKFKFSNFEQYSTDYLIFYTGLIERIIITGKALYNELYWLRVVFFKFTIFKLND